MNELATKLAAQIETLNAKQATALQAAEASGVSEEDRAKHLAEFDAIQKEKERAQASYKRADQLARDQAAASAPRTPAVQQPYNPSDPNADRVPARPRAFGKLRVYTGPDGERDAYAAGRFFAASLYGHRKSAEWCESNGIASFGGATLGPSANIGAGAGNSNQGGAIFVPDVIETQIIKITQQYGVLRRLAEVKEMTSDTLSTPRWSQAMVAYWVGRGQKPPSSDPQWNAVQLIAKDLAAMTKIGRQLNEDALINLGDEVTENVAFAFSFAEDNAWINGDGSSTYGGIPGVLALLALAVNAPSLIAAAATHNTAAKLTMADFLNVIGSYPAYPNAKPVWVCHKSVWAQSMVNLQLAIISGVSGGGTRKEDVAAGGSMEFLGYPVEFSQVMPTAAAAVAGSIPVLFGDPRLCTKLGDRRQRSVQAGYENDDFTRQLMTLLGTQRIDINTHTITDPKTPTQPGPMLGLQLTA